MKSIVYGDEIIEYELIRKKKKNLSITIKPDAKVVVSVPIGIKDEYVEKKLYEKIKWIVTKLHEVRKKIIVVKQKEYISGESFMYLGENYKFKIIKDENIKKTQIKLERGIFEIKIPVQKEIHQKDIKSIIEKWYKEQAIKTIEERVILYSGKIKLYPVLIRIKELKSSWGLCTSKGSITLNWRLIIAPLSVMDYVVIHELCHLKHHNHSKEFWGLVGVYMTDYKTRKEWLKANGIRLVI